MPNTELSNSKAEQLKKGPELLPENIVLRERNKELVDKADQLAENLEQNAEKKLDKAVLSEQEKEAASQRIAEIVQSFKTGAEKIKKEHYTQEAKMKWGLGMLKQLDEFRSLDNQASTPEGLLSANLDDLSRVNQIEVLRERAISTAVKGIKSAEDLRSFEAEYPMNNWGRKEFFELTNRYRLLGSAKDEIRLFEQSENTDFLKAPRAREFYSLALIKDGRSKDALGVTQELIKDGLDNSLVRGIRGDAYARQAEAIRALQEQTSEANILSYEKKYGSLTAEQLTPRGLEMIRRENTASAAKEYRKGFDQDMSSFSALGMNEQSRQMLTDLYRDRAELQSTSSLEGSSVGSKDQLAKLDSEIALQKKLLKSQESLIELSLEMQGGGDSTDFWGLAGAVQLAAIRSEDPERIRELGRKALLHADAGFKIDTMVQRLKELERTSKELALAEGKDPAEQNRSVSNAIAMFEESLALFNKDGKALSPEDIKAIEQKTPKDHVEKYLKGSINFRALTGSLVPTYIPGGIGRTGARVPDLMINREDNRVFKSIITELGIANETNPRVVKDSIEKYVREKYGTDRLQDLQGPDHKKFDTRSDGGIELAGIASDMRQDTHSITNLSASLLAGIGDCRETMYSVGALFATQQKMRVQSLVEKGLAALDKKDTDSFDKLMDGQIADATRYQLRGEQVAVYVENMAVDGKYAPKKSELDPSFAAGRNYGMKELQENLPLTKYELENAIIEVTYADGSRSVLTPKRGTPHENENGSPIFRDKKGEIIPTDQIKAIKLLSYVEDHTLSQLFDKKTGTVELADAFYDNTQYNGPYKFGEGVYDIKGAKDGLVSAGTTTILLPDGTTNEAKVSFKTLRYSKTEYAPSLGEADSGIRLDGRPYDVDVVQELSKIKSGESKFAKAVDRIYEWWKAKSS